MADIKVFYSKKTDDWKTPEKLYNALMEKGYKDPCPYKATKNGLDIEYPPATKIFINPPFSKMKEWIEFGVYQYLYNRCEVCFLIPARTDTKYFHLLLELNPKIYFIKGRLHYNESEKNAPFPSLFIRLKPFGINERIYNSMDLDTLINRIMEDLL